MPSFSEKELEITVVLGKGTFGGEGNTKIIKGLAAKCVIEKVHLPDKNKAKVQIYGVKLEDMEQMTTLAFLPLETQKNYVQIKAGEKDQELSLVFNHPRWNMQRSRFSGSSQTAGLMPGTPLYPESPTVPGSGKTQTR